MSQATTWNFLDAKEHDHRNWNIAALNLVKIETGMENNDIQNTGIPCKTGWIKTILPRKERKKKAQLFIFL